MQQNSRSNSSDFKLKVLHFYDVLSPLKTSSPAAGSKTATLADPSYVEPGKATAELLVIQLVTEGILTTVQPCLSYLVI